MVFEQTGPSQEVDHVVMQHYQRFVSSGFKVDHLSIDEPHHVMTKETYQHMWNALGSIEEQVPQIQFMMKSAKLDINGFQDYKDYPYQLFVNSSLHE
jgi:hypothetical protein